LEQHFHSQKPASWPNNFINSLLIAKTFQDIPSLVSILDSALPHHFKNLISCNSPTMSVMLSSTHLVMSFPWLSIALHLWMSPILLCTLMSASTQGWRSYHRLETNQNWHFCWSLCRFSGPPPFICFGYSATHNPDKEVTYLHLSLFCHFLDIMDAAEIPDDCIQAFSCQYFLHYKKVLAYWHWHFCMMHSWGIGGFCICSMSLRLSFGLFSLA